MDGLNERPSRVRGEGELQTKSGWCDVSDEVQDPFVLTV
jgi:hypothetical protein